MLRHRPHRAIGAGDVTGMLVRVAVSRWSRQKSHARSAGSSRRLDPNPCHLSYDPFMSSTAPDTVNDENARYKRAIRTAEELFKKVGFRAVTMELVAREANVAKATLYSYFKNKDELYLAVCARMARILRGSVEQALMKPDAPLDERL